MGTVKFLVVFTVLFSGCSTIQPITKKQLLLLENPPQKVVEKVEGLLNSGVRFTEGCEFEALAKGRKLTPSEPGSE